MTPEHDERQQVITAAFVVITIFAVLCALASSAGADDSAYLRARAAIAINASLSTKGGTDPAPSPVEAAKPKTEAKPVVNLYSATWCAPCQRAKAELKAAANDLPFTVRIVDVSNGGQPAYVESLPWVSWPKAEGEVWQRSYPGVKELVSQWKQSQSKTGSAITSGSTTPTKLTATNRTLALRQFAASYRGQTTGVKGSTLSHLMEPKHGFTAHELQGLTEWELERLHSACHFWGLHASQLRAMADKRGL